MKKKQSSSIFKIYPVSDLIPERRDPYKTKKLLASGLAIMLACSIFAPIIPAFAVGEFNKGMVTLSFDDGWKSIYDNGIPIVEAAGFTSTQYIYTEPMFGATQCEEEGQDCFTDFMNVSEVQTLLAAGHDVAAHTRTHIDLTTTSTAGLVSEVDGSRTDLLGAIGGPVDNLAYPYGAFNDTVLAQVQSAGFVGARTVDDSQLNATTTNPYTLFGHQVNSGTTLEQVQAYIDQAIAEKHWVILVFHQIVPECDADGLTIPPEEGGGLDIYCTHPDTLQSIVDYIASKGNTIDVVTVSEGIARMNDVPVGPDTTPPVIEAHANVTATATSSNQVAVNYTSPSATDNIDGNVPVSCVPPSGSLFTIGTTTVTCTASDASNNSATSTFSVIVADGQDATPPVITLLGDATVTIEQDTAYTDAGATAEDNIDGNITTNIVVNNPVATTTIGSYTVTYNVSDAAGNAATEVTRTVNVIAAQPAPTPEPSSSGGGGGGGGGTSFGPALVNPSVIINNNSATTDTRNVTLSLHVRNGVQMLISNSASFNGATWQPYATSTSWTLSEGNGQKIVYAKFRNSSNRDSSVASDSITLEAQATSNPSPTSGGGQVLGESTTAAHAEGTLIRDGGTVYRIENGTRRPFRNAAEFLTYSYSFNQVVPANDADRALPHGELLKAMTGTLVLDTTDNRTVYMIGLNGTKRGFTTEAVFKALGYSFTDLARIDVTDYAPGPVVDSSTEAHPDGALVVDSRGTVWWILDRKRRAFVSSQILMSYGFRFSDVVAANSADLQLTEDSAVASR